MATIVTRSGKGSPLTNNEVDANFNNLNTEVGAALAKAGGAMTGAITTNSTFDGRDVATDGTKLDGVEASADVTDTANVTSAGALMDSELTSIASVKALNQGLATGNSPTFVNVTATSLLIPNASSGDALKITAADQANARITIDNLNGQAFQLVAGTPGASNSGFAIFDSDAGATRFQIASNGGITTTSIAGGHTVFNENGIDADFRVESDGNTNMLFVDGGNNRVGVGTTPVYTFDILAASAVSMIRTNNTTSPTLGLFVNSGANGVGTISVDNGGHMTFDTGSNGAGQTERFRIAADGAATFTGTVTANAGVVVDNITIDGNEIDVSSGNLTLDVAGNIFLNADGSLIIFADGSVEFGRVGNSSSDFAIQALVQDKDIVFKGNDNGTIITALTLDMSNAGRANFNNGIGGTYIEDNVTPLIVRATNTNTAALWGMYAQYRNVSVNGAGAGMSLGMETANGTEAEYVYIGSIIEDNTNSDQHGTFVVAPVYAGTRAERLRITSAGSITTTPVAGTAFVINEGGVDADFRIESNANTHMLFVDGGANVVAVGGNVTADPWTGYYPLAIGSNLMIGSTGASSTFTNFVHGGYWNGSAWLQRYTDVTQSRHEMIGAQAGSTHNFYTSADVNVDTAVTEVKNLSLYKTESVFNEGGVDLDFRVESDGSTHALFVDGSSGNVIVSGTAAGQATSVALHNTGYVHAVSSHQMAGIFDRRDSDGDILIFRKNGSGTAVGSIGTYGGDLWVGQGNTGLIFNDGGDVIHVANASGGDRNGVCDLGTTASRFKDIHLAGNVNASGIRVMEGTSLAGGMFKEKAVTGTGSSLDLSFFAESVNGGGDIHFMTGGAAAKKLTIAASGLAKLSVGLTVARDTNLGSAIVTIQSNNGGGLAIGYGTGTNEFRRIYQHSTGLYFQSSTNQAYLSASGAWTNASDVTLKKDIEDIDYGIETVKSLKPRKYKMKSDDEAQIGFIAQELVEQVPEIVGGKDGLLGVSYGQLTAVLTKAIQEQQTLIESLTARIAALEE